MRAFNIGRRGRRGSGALPAVLALTIGVGALTAGYSMRALRESNRFEYQRGTVEALYQAWGQMELVAHIVNTANYDGEGRNEALVLALGVTPAPEVDVFWDDTQTAVAPDGEFIGPDGWRTGVYVREITQGGAPTGMYELASVATQRGATRIVSALIRERQSFADFNYFVANHDLGISGGESAVWPYVDAPEGSIHSNKTLTFYLENRHFRDAVTAAEGFGYASGAAADNTFFHGPTNDAADKIEGLTDVDPESFATRTDNVLTLNGEHDYAHVYLKGDVMQVKHYEKTYYEDQTITTVEPVYEWIGTPGLVKEWEKITWQEPVTVTDYEWQDVWVYGPVTKTIRVEVDAGGVDLGGAGGSGSTYIEQTVTVDEWHWESQKVAVGTHTEMKTKSKWQWTGEWIDGTIWEQVQTGTETVTETVSVKVQGGHRETFDLPASGTVYVEGDIHLKEMWNSAHGFDVQTLDGSVTLASGDDIWVKDSVVYAHPDDANVMQPAFLNGDDPTKEYKPNAAYQGTSVLGLLAKDDIEYHKNMPDKSEVNATMLAKEGQVNADRIRVKWDGTVEEESNGWTKSSLRRLGGIISNRRPVSSFINEDNVVTRGFISGKSVFDRRQLTNPPRGFPTLRRPRVLATVLKEVK